MRLTAVRNRCQGVRGRASEHCLKQPVIGEVLGNAHVHRLPGLCSRLTELTLNHEAGLVP